jgi:3-deoxy-D-manno-octulosonic-acid transferase
LPLLAALPADLTVLFTTGTRTSATLLTGRLAGAPPPCTVIHQFVPLDVPRWAARFLDHWRPDAAAFLESELWPNLLAALRARGIPAALVNARLSARSAVWWRRAPAFARAVLSCFAWIAAQSPADAARLRTLGASAVDAPGNLKLCAPPLPSDPAEHARLQALLADRPRWLAASTHPADDDLIAATHRALAARHPGLLTAIVPRHPERGADLAARLGARRRALGDDPPGSGLWIADTLGELGLLYRCFPIVLMGKSFARGGGQNPWEPAQLGCAVVCGPDMDNFADAVTRLRQAGALDQVADGTALLDWLDAMLSQPDRLDAARRAARTATAQANDLPAELAARLMRLMAA